MRNGRLSFGIFLIIADSEDLDNYKLLSYTVPCDTAGIATETPAIPLNSKSGASYNHKAMWDRHVKNNSLHKPYNKKDYAYYPRGRVEISNNRAVIYLNPQINRSEILEDIKSEFGLGEESISKIRVVSDNSAHYKCFLDRKATQWISIIFLSPRTSPRIIKSTNEEAVTATLWPQSQAALQKPRMVYRNQ